MRPSGRTPEAMRPVTLEPGFAKYAEGSCFARFGDTHVLCTASVEERVPPFLRNTGRGWVTAEYGMLPRSTHTRTDREAARGRQSGRTQEIQRLIGRSLRAVTDLAALGERQIRIDCDVLQADGGTRTAAITGSYVALHQAVAKFVAAGIVASLDHGASHLAFRAERHVVALLGGGCSLPVGAYAEVTDGRVRLVAVVLRPDGTGRVRAEAEAEGPEEAAELVVRDLRAEGADRILADLAR